MIKKNKGKNICTGNIPLHFERNSFRNAGVFVCASKRRVHAGCLVEKGGMIYARFISPLWSERRKRDQANT